VPPAPLTHLLAQAAGFAAGALAGYVLARLLGIDLLRDPYGSRSVLAVAAIGLCGGIGIGAARRWCGQRGLTPPSKD